MIIAVSEVPEIRHKNGNDGQQSAHRAERWHSWAPENTDHHGDGGGLHRNTMAKGFLPDDGWAHADKTRHQGSSRIRLLRCCVRSGGNFCQHVDQRSQPTESFPQTEYRTHSRRPQYTARTTTAPAARDHPSCHARTRSSDTPRWLGTQ